MNADNPTSNQHYVPKAYQRLFSTPGHTEMVYRFEPNDKYNGCPVKLRSIKVTGSKDWYYELEKKEGSSLPWHNVELNQTEKFGFTYEEDELRETFREFSDSETLTQDTVIYTLRLAHLLKLRNPSFIDNDFGVDFRVELRDMMTNALMDKVVRGDLPPDKYLLRKLIQDMVKPLGSPEDIANLLPVLKKFSLSNGVDDSEIGKHISGLLKGQLIRLVTDDANLFITSDNPGTFSSAQHGPHTMPFDGWEKFFFPVTPTAAILVLHPNSVSTDYKGTFMTIKALPEVVDFYNGTAGMVSHRFVFGGNEFQVTKARNYFVANFKANL